MEAEGSPRGTCLWLNGTTPALQPALQLAILKRETGEILLVIYF